MVDAIHVKRQKLLPSAVGIERLAAQRRLQVDHPVYFRPPAEPRRQTFGATPGRQAFVLAPHEDEVDVRVAHRSDSSHCETTDATGVTVRFQSNCAAIARAAARRASREMSSIFSVASARATGSGVGTRCLAGPSFTSTYLL